MCLVITLAVASGFLAAVTSQCFGQNHPTDMLRICCSDLIDAVWKSENSAVMWQITPIGLTLCIREVLMLSSLII